MSKKEDITKEQPVEEQAEEKVEQVEEQAEEQPQEDLNAKVAELEARVADLEDLKLRQMAEFDNFRRRTNKEKLDLIENAGEGIFKNMLPLLDDFERALAAFDKSDDVNALREGVQLIYQKFRGFLEQNKVTEIETEGKDFDTDEHEAVTTFAAGEDKKGKIIDCTQKGYKLGDKVIRFAKVVVGE